MSENKEMTLEERKKLETQVAALFAGEERADEMELLASTICDATRITSRTSRRISVLRRPPESTPLKFNSTSRMISANMGGRASCPGRKAMPSANRRAGNHGKSKIQCR